MRHSHIVEGYAFRLRPVEDADARFLLDLRQGQPYMNIGAQTLEEQLQWLQEYYARADDYYFIIETKQSRSPVGATGLYAFDHDRARAYWGRWVVVPKSVAATESALLSLRFAFGTMGLAAVMADVITANSAVISFHHKCGMRDLELRRGCHMIGEKRYDGLIMEMDTQAFERTDKKLEALATRLARKIH